MRHLCLSLLCALGMMLMGCGGGGSSANTLTGNWSATLTTSDGATFLTFIATLTQGNSSVIGVSNLNVSTVSSCFATDTTASGTLGMDGALQMTLQSGSSNSNGVNQVTLQGTPSNNTISGTWNLSGTGAGCTGTGPFTMIR